MSVFNRDAGTSTLAWRAAKPLRMRVSISAIGSDVVIPYPPFRPALRLPNSSPGSPRCLGHSRHFARQRQLAEADAAQLKLTQIAAGTPAAQAAIALFAAQPGLLGRPGYGQSFVSSNLRGSRHGFLK